MVSSYSDLDKASKDLINKDFNDDFKIKVESAQGGKLTTNVSKGAKGVKGDVSLKQNIHDFDTTIKIGTDGKVSVESKRNVIDGVKVTAKVESGNQRSIKAEYENEKVNSTLNLNLSAAPKVGVNAVADVHAGLLAGVEVEYDTSAGLSKANALFRYDFAKEQKFTLGINNSGSEAVLGYYHGGARVGNAAFRAAFNRSTGDSKVDIGLQRQVNASDFVKARVNSKGVAGLAYVHKWGRGNSIGFSSQFDAADLGKLDNQKFGINVVLA